MTLSSVQGSLEEGQDHPLGYCFDANCWCHFDVGYHESVTEMPRTVAEEEYQQALLYFGVVNAS